jgi:hypothetical protein
MKETFMSLLKIVLRIGIAYCVVLLFAVKFNILEWGFGEKILFLLVAFLLLIQD